MTTLRPGTPVMEAYSTVRKAICQQVLKPGKTLTENYLCETLGLGRSPIRAALQQLCVDGYIEMTPGRSARVAQFSQEQIRQLYAMRGMLINHAFEMTIETYTPNDILYLKDCLNQQENAFANYDFESYLSTFISFYRYIIHKANNPYFDEIADQILKRINVYLSLYDNFYSAKKLKTLPLYRKMIKAIEAGKLKTVQQIHKEICARILDAYDHMILTNIE